jgi:hypothetical protein
MLTLIVPGLIWPRQTFSDLSFDLPLPAFSSLLGRGKVRSLPPQDSHACMASLLGVGTSLPAAALRQPDHADRETHWLCLDPVLMRFEQQTLVLDDPATLNLTDDEAEALLAHLSPIFQDFGQLMRLAPTRWNLRLTVPAPAFKPLPDTLHRSGPLLPRDPAYARWRQAMSEAEIALHAHPVNQARAAQARPTVSGVAPWGGGCLSQLAIPPAKAPFILQADDPVLQGLANWLGGQPRPCHAGYTPDAAAVLLSGLDFPTRRGDSATWREELQRIDADWLAPALHDLKRGTLDSLRLVLPGTQATLDVQMRRLDGLKVWRKPIAPATALDAFLPP